MRPPIARTSIENIDKLLEDAADELGDVPGASGTGDVSSAISYAEKVNGLVSKLDRVKGDDSTAKDMVSRYPNYIRSFKESAGYLSKLKEKQNSLKELPKKCENLDSNLRKTVEKYVKAKDSKGLSELPKAAEDGSSQSGLLVERRRTHEARYAGLALAFEAFLREPSRMVRCQKQAALCCGKGLRDLGRRLGGVRGRRAKTSRRATITPRSRRESSRFRCHRRGAPRSSSSLRDTSKMRRATFATCIAKATTAIFNELYATLATFEAPLTNSKSHEGTERRAKEIVEKWPGYTEHLKRAIGDLRKLKKWQSTLDKGPRACEEADRKLDDLIRKYAKDSDGIKKLPEAASKLGETIRKRLKKADDFKRSMEDFKRVPERFSASDSAWRDVVSNVQSSAKETYDYWEDALEKTHDKCDELAKGVNADKVKRAIGKLKKGAGSKIDEYADDVNDWVKDARKTYTLDCSEMKRLWKAYCGADWEPNESPKSAAKKVGDEVQTTMKARVDPVLARHMKLKARGEELAKKSALKRKASSLLRKLEKHDGRLNNLKKNGYRGNNHPLTQFSAAYGKDQHKRMESDYSCTIKDQEYPGADGRPDCVIASTCMVLEFKPNNAEAKEEGEEQLDRYVPAVTKYYQSHIDNKTTPETKLGGSAIIDTLEAECMDGKSVEFGRDLKTYDMCKLEHQCVE